MTPSLATEPEKSESHEIMNTAAKSQLTLLLDAIESPASELAGRVFGVRELCAVYGVVGGALLYHTRVLFVR